MVLRMSVCKFCNLGGFEWTQDQNTGKWALVDANRRPHNCKNKISLIDSRLASLEAEILQIKKTLDGLVH